MADGKPAAAAAADAALSADGNRIMKLAALLTSAVTAHGGAARRPRNAHQLGLHTVVSPVTSSVHESDGSAPERGLVPTFRRVR